MAIIYNSVSKEWLYKLSRKPWIIPTCTLAIIKIKIHSMVYTMQRTEKSSYLNTNEQKSLQRESNVAAGEVKKDILPLRGENTISACLSEIS